MNLPNMKAEGKVLVNIIIAHQHPAPAAGGLRENE